MVVFCNLWGFCMVEYQLYCRLMLPLCCLGILKCLYQVTEVVVMSGLTHGCGPSLHLQEKLVLGHDLHGDSPTHLAPHIQHPG